MNSTLELIKLYILEVQTLHKFHVGFMKIILFKIFARNLIKNEQQFKECSLPMCPECIKIHSEEHLEERISSDIDLFSNCLTEQYNKSLEYLKLWAIDVQESSRSLKGIIILTFKILRSKKEFYKVIDNYFKMFEQTNINE
ncbi:unnamed protein product [Paramecium sonneborni]|uniref:Uncharacterized protein n=1 Tax=Paramecium sonneborni TaxID=65129 RepID=A0A8S1KJI5_9CILI|nr:unnamed protein product [Paramecium sonneborni]CAD8053266.1 unnamed protein product [Paramecium sonneborni]